jgi:hypothetical protein
MLLGKKQLFAKNIGCGKLSTNYIFQKRYRNLPYQNSLQTIHFNKLNNFDKLIKIGFNLTYASMNFKNHRIRIKTSKSFFTFLSVKNTYNLNVVITNVVSLRILHIYTILLLIYQK